MSPRHPILPLALLLTLALGACTTSLTQLQTARVLEPGHVEFTGALNAPVGTQAIEAIVDLGDQAQAAAEQAVEDGELIGEDEARDVFASSLGLILFQPAIVPEVVGRVGIIDKLDLGVRTNGALIKFDGRYQLWRNEQGAAVAASLGFAHHFEPASSVLNSLGGVLDFIKLGDFSRQDLELGVLASIDFDPWLSLYGGARYVGSLLALDATIQDVEAVTGADIVEVDQSLHHFGGTAGLRIGYRYVFLSLELSIFAVLFEPEILGEPVDYNGAIVVPSGGLTFVF